MRGPVPPSDPAGSSPPPSGPTTRRWQALEREIVACTNCPLHRSRLHTVAYRGGRRPWILFVGEAPGAAEDRSGVPFVGRAGRRLDEALQVLGLSCEEVGVVNLIKCRPPGNRFPRESALACRGFLDRQLALLRPRAIVTLGRHALGAFDPRAPPITVAAGAPRRWRGRPLFPLLHPAASLHAPALRSRWSNDLATLRPLVAEWRPRAQPH